MLRNATAVQRAAGRGRDWRQGGILETSRRFVREGDEPDGNGDAQT